MAISGARKAMISFQALEWKGLVLKIGELGDNKCFFFGFGGYYRGNTDSIDCIMMFSKDFVSKTTFSFYADRKNIQLINKGVFFFCVRVFFFFLFFLCF